MTQRNRNYLKAYRRKADLTQAALAEAVGTTASVISLLECGRRKLSPEWLRRLSGPLGASPGEILEVDPEKVSDEKQLLELWLQIHPKDRGRALEVLKAFKGSSA